MRILFDQGTPRPLRDHLSEHAVDTAAEKGWSELSNGELLDHTETEAYELMITTDQNMRHQQNLGHRQMAIIVLLSNRWPRIQSGVEEVRNAVERIQPGELRQIPL